ncbi:MAG: diacylglycerol kinase family lipid kinase [Calditrichaeota bacterium]|nr:MAG: diacylglycerol kinase family lipid kinase [Calditrichota bacterium]
MKAAFILNPAAGRGKALQMEATLQNEAQRLFPGAPIVRSARPGHARNLAAQLGGTHDTVIAVGGDGTIHEVVNGLMENKAALGIVPVGTGNDLVKALNIPRDTQAALQLIRNTPPRPIDVGRVNDGYFINGLGIGFDAWVVKRSLSVKKLRGNLVYLYAVLATLGSYSHCTLEIDMDGNQSGQDLFLMTIGNGPSLGGGFKLTPGARLDDGWFDICTIRKMHIPRVLRNLLRVYRGTHIHDPRVEISRCREITVRSTIPFAAHADGEALGYDLTELKMSVLPGALHVYCNY